MLVVGLAFACLASQAKPQEFPKWILVGNEMPSEAIDAKLAEAANLAALQKITNNLKYELVKLENGICLLYDPILIYGREPNLNALRSFIAKASGAEPVKLSELDPEAQRFASNLLRRVGAYRDLSDDAMGQMLVHVGPRVQANLSVGGRSEPFWLDPGPAKSMRDKLAAGHSFNDLSKLSTTPPNSGTVKFRPFQMHFEFSSAARMSSSELDLGTLATNYLTKLKDDFLKQRDKIVKPTLDKLLSELGLEQYSSGKSFNTLDDLSTEDRTKIENNINGSWQVFGWDSPSAAAKNWAGAKLLDVKRGLVLEYGMPSSANVPAIGRSPLGNLSKNP